MRIRRYELRRIIFETLNEDESLEPQQLSRSELKNISYDAWQRLNYVCKRDNCSDVNDLFLWQDKLGDIYVKDPATLETWMWGLEGWEQ